MAQACFLGSIMLSSRLPVPPRLHQRTRKSLVRGLWLLLGLGPLLVSCGWAVWVHSPWHVRQLRRHWSEQLTQQVGLEVQLAGVAQMAPGQFRLEGLVCCHPETGQEILRARLVELWRRPEGWVVRLAQPEVQVGQALAVWQVLHDWFLSRPSKTAAAWQVAVSDVTLHAVGQGVTLVDLRLDLQASPEQTAVTARFALADAPLQGPATVEVVRSHRPTRPGTRLRLSTGGQQLPGPLLADYFPWVAMLGERAELSGSLLWQADTVGRQLELSGQVEQVNFGQLTAHLPNQLTGLGQLQLSGARWLDGHLQQLHGELSSLYGGRVSQAWLEAAAQRLDWVGFGDAVVPGVIRGQRSYQHLRLGFEIDEQGCRLVGRLDGDPEGRYQGILADANGLLLASTAVPNRLANERVVQWLCLPGESGAPRVPTLAAGEGGSQPLAEWLMYRMPGRRTADWPKQLPSRVADRFPIPAVRK